MRYAHTNIAAKDWEKLADFYIHVFHCRIKPPVRDLSGEWLDKAIGLSNAKLKGVHLQLPGHGENGPTLEIFSYENFKEFQPVMADHIGFTHIAFEVDNVEAVFQSALSKGGKQLGEVTNKLVDGVGMLKLVYFRDPEGNIVEIQSWEK